LSLSVEEDNHRALALYTKLGFRGLNLHGNAWTMHFRV
jgi:ribosomal protein S18 acetylase RimI-like enzyme